jgi:halocyanin-like protein
MSLAAVGITSTGGCLGGPDDVGPSTESPPTVSEAPRYEGWVGDAPTYDRLDADTVTVFAGIEGNGGYYAFEPEAVAITPGTTVVWRWTGRGGRHNVVGLNRQFRSQLTNEEGFTYSHTAGPTGVVKYYCGPHRSQGMRGVLEIRTE